MEITFPHDGDVTLKVPKSHKFGPIFAKRCQHEILFRKVHQVLFKQGIIDTTMNIIDLGAWIGDNTLPWAKAIDGKVYAIDPSTANCDFIRILTELNDVKNVDIIQLAIHTTNLVLISMDYS